MIRKLAICVKNTPGAPSAPLFFIRSAHRKPHAAP